MRKQIQTVGLFVLVVSGFLGTRCNLQPQAGTGKLRVLVTDKPYPYEWIEEALVTITKVEVRRAEAEDEPDDGGEGVEPEGGQDVAGGEPADDGSPFVTIFEGEKTFNLLDLQNGRTDLLADAEDLPAGTYNQMRVYVPEGRVTLKDGAGEFNLTVPSGAQTGIKLHFEFEVVADEETVLLLDVDLSRAFSAIPSGHIEDPTTIEGFTFSPSVAMRLIELLEAGSISGVVTASADGTPVAAAAVAAFDESDQQVTGTSTEADGSYTLGGLHTGTYRVEVSAAGFADAEVTGVAVQAGEETASVNFALDAAE